MERYQKNEAPGSSDISKCGDNRCPARMDCHRYLVKPTEVDQSYIIWQPGKSKGYDCHLYWPEYEDSPGRAALDAAQEEERP